VKNIRKKKEEGIIIPTPLLPSLVTNGDAECLLECATPELQQSWVALYGAELVKREALKAAAWLKANPKKKKKDTARFLGNWLAKTDTRKPGGFKTKDEVRSENNLSLLAELTGGK
jgi:hypothetical protein